MKPLGVLLTVAMLLLLVVAPASADPPPSSGIVVRYDGEFGGFNNCTDEYCALYGVLDPVAMCAGSPVYNILPIQEITLPQYEDVLRIVQHVHGDVQVFVYPIDLFSCASADDYVAAGTVRLNYTDNDVYAWMEPDRPNANAWSWTAQGMISDNNGEPVRFHAVYKLTWKPDGSLYNENSHITLR